MQNYFDVDDAEWIASEARKLWTNEPDRDENRLNKILIQNPQPHLRMPDWIDFDLDAFGSQYYRQIMRLWQTLFDRGNSKSDSCYDVSEHEQDAAYESCPIRFPGYMARRDPEAIKHAGYELAMLGDVMVHSGLSSGMHAIEYGAGSGNIAINLARLGVAVDTVDISQTYCDHIAQNAEFYGIDLKSHRQEFGFNPKGEGFKYDCILFHACFHHSIDHARLVAGLPAMLADNGVIILSNEPIFDDFYCPWGLRTDPECISVVAARGWMELGFRTDYLQAIFAKAGMILSRMPDNLSQVPMYIARKIAGTPDCVSPGLKAPIIEGVHWVESDGTWVGAESNIRLDDADQISEARITMTNCFPFAKSIHYAFGHQTGEVAIAGGESTVVTITLRERAGDQYDGMKISTEATRPCDHIADSEDQRPLGVKINGVAYRVK